MGSYVKVGGELLDTAAPVPQDPDKWMTQAVLAEAATFGIVGVTRRGLGGSFLWMKSPPAVLAMERHEKTLLLNRTLRRLVRYGLLRAEKGQEPIKRRGDRGERRALTTVNRYYKVNVLEAIARAAAD